MKESVLLSFRVVVRIVPSKTFLLLGCNCVDDQIAATVRFGVVFLDGFLYASDITVIDISEAFELLVCPITDHSNIGDEATAPELGP